MGQPKSSNDLSAGLRLRPLLSSEGVPLRMYAGTPLLPGVVTFSILFTRDGKSFLYAIPSRHDVTIYRQNWQAGQLIGQPQVALRLPFAFPLVSGGNAYDITRDLSTVV
jgi:hypothetical protein